MNGMVKSGMQILGVNDLDVVFKEAGILKYRRVQKSYYKILII